MNRLSETLLWKVVCAKVTELSRLPVILEDIGYLDDKDHIMSLITYCEVFDSEGLEIIDYFVVQE